ncbi:MAG TPA: ABC transporter permease [Acidimicrobiales bacterium]|nr:ABC transporter permease [Acidimicrobiales bacterium]
MSGTVGTSVSRPPRLAGFSLRLGPTALIGGRRALRVLERNVVVYRRGWAFIVSGFFEPFFYLLSIGVGLSKLVGLLHVAGHPISYPMFAAPGLLAASAMNGAIFDSTFQMYFQLKIAKTYEAVLATPLSPADLALGQMGWAVSRGALYSGAFLCVMAGLGDVFSNWVVLCYPAAVLIAFAFAGAGMAGTTYMRSWQDFDMVSLAILPMFLFSGIFYPLAVYPGWLQLVVRGTPLYQGVALLRGLDLGLFGWPLLGHALYLGAMGFVGLIVTSRRLTTLVLP